jgi:hypothetical protein
MHRGAGGQAEKNEYPGHEGLAFWKKMIFFQNPEDVDRLGLECLQGRHALETGGGDAAKTRKMGTAGGRWICHPDGISTLSGRRPTGATANDPHHRPGRVLSPGPSGSGKTTTLRP